MYLFNFTLNSILFIAKYVNVNRSNRFVPTIKCNDKRFKYVMSILIYCDNSMFLVPCKRVKR